MSVFFQILPFRRHVLTALLMLFSLLFLVTGRLMAQDELFSPSKIQAIHLFEDGNFEEAIRHFDALLIKYPADPLYKYYSGVCLVETGKNQTAAADLLKEALDEGSSLRPVPMDGWYYLGRAYQSSDKFDKAILCYDRFRESVRRKELKEYRIEELIDQCSAGIGSDKAEMESIGDPVSEDEQSDTMMVGIYINQDVAVDSIPQSEMVPLIIIEAEDTPADYDIIAGQALEYQFKADSLSRLANRYRSTVKTLTGQDRETISKKILELETLTFNYQSLADKKLAEAAKFNRVFYDGEDKAEIAIDVVSDIVVLDSIDVIPEVDTLVIAEERIDSEVARDPILVLFDPDSKQPDKIPVNDTLPEGLFYRIQTAAFRNPIKPLHFQSLGPVYGIKAKGSDITFYSIGFFRKKLDADRAVIKVRAVGFKDAFVIAQMEGERISFERSMVLENEWGEISLIDPAKADQIQKPSEPATLVFRVQVIVSEKELPEEEVETLRLVAGNRDFDVLLNDAEEYVYLIGKFLTFESALGYSDLLYRNGMKEARVAAYMGVKEIPVDKARELFDFNINK